MIRHTAGGDATLRYRLSLNLIRAGLGEERSDLLSRFIEFWCQKNCVGDWRVEETNLQLCVWFDRDQDIVMFKFSEEYDYFSSKIIPQYDVMQAAAFLPRASYSVSITA